MNASAKPHQRERDARRRQFNRIKALAAMVHNQLQLDAILVDIPDVFMRHEVFKLIEPMLKFKAEWPERWGAAC